jgi:hypothetical protein
MAGWLLGGTAPTDATIRILSALSSRAGWTSPAASSPPTGGIHPIEHMIVHTGTMAFGQSAGPPATGRQLAQLLELLQAAGHSDFRDARGPLGFTQRQAAGKFSRAEAEALIEQLDQQTEQGSTEATGAGLSSEGPPPRRRGVDTLLEGVPTPTLAAELQRRGWIVVEP